MVFQGTVLGPILWNVMYEDSRLPLVQQNFTDVVYADDLNGFKEYDRSVPDGTLLDDAKKCQEELHTWGQANQIIFDPNQGVHTHPVPDRRDTRIVQVPWCQY